VQAAYGSGIRDRSAPALFLYCVKLRISAADQGWQGSFISNIAMLSSRRALASVHAFGGRNSSIGGGAPHAKPALLCP